MGEPLRGCARRTGHDSARSTLSTGAPERPARRAPRPLLVACGSDKIRVETSAESAPRTGSGADHNDLEDTFSFDRDGQVAFSTPTLDAGTTVTIAEE